MMCILALAHVSFSQYHRFVTRSRRSEAYLGLAAIWKLQTQYFATVGAYAPSFDALGFQIDGGVPLGPNTVRGGYYTYTLQTWDVNGVANGNYRATATGNTDRSDGVLDIIIIENDLRVVE